jgi:protein TonB
MSGSGSDRLLFAFFIAAVAHGLFIFGVRFHAAEPNREGFAMAVTLVQEAQAEPVQSAVRALQHQAGSGDGQQYAEVRADQMTLWQDSEQNPLVTFLPQYSDHPALRWVVITSRGVGHWGIAPQQQQPALTPQFSPAEPELNVASLRALLDHRRQSYTELPRVRTLTALSAQQAPEAEYVLAWQQRVQATGNANYPDVARTQRLSGEVQLLTSIAPDGALVSVGVLTSSGEAVLDAAALAAVENAAPYAPFAEFMRTQYDVLEIIRTFRFDVESGLQLEQAS